MGIQYLSHFVGGEALKSIPKKPALYRRDGINPCFKACKKWHFRRIYEHIFCIIALEEVHRASTCFKMAYLKTAIKWTIFGSKIYFYISTLLDIQNAFNGFLIKFTYKTNNFSKYGKLHKHPIWFYGKITFKIQLFLW